MSSPEVERFEMSDTDYYQMFDPTGNRRRQTKDDATYGIWADKDSDDSGDEMAGLGARGKGKKKPAGRGRGASIGGGGAGISFVSGGFKEEEKKDASKDIVNETWIEKKKSSSKEAPMPRYVKGHQQDQDRGFGSWERHTKGIGQKLLLKMGHKPGEGLGKKGQGITTPVEAVKRKGHAAIGYYGKERSERSLKDFPVKDEEEEEEKEFKKQLSQWRKQPVEGKKKQPKYVYKTAQEVLDSGGVRRSRPAPDAATKVKVIDMTGKEQRVLSGYHAIGKGHDKPDEEEVLVVPEAPRTRAFDMPELMHNLNLLVDMAEDDIVQNHRKLRHNQDRIVNLEHEEDRLHTVVEQEARQLERLQTVLDLVMDCEKRCKSDSPDPLTLDSCLGVFKMLQQDYYEEYKIYDLPSLAIALVFPLMRTFFTGWLPLHDPKFGLHTVMEWQLLLGADASAMTSEMRGKEMDVYQRLIWEVWLPPVRATILKWSVRDTEPMISLLETWSPALPSWVLENILDQLVLPRLLQEVENWNPLTDTTPIHCWLHPWLPLMGEKLEPLYAPIRHKIANALTSWHPSDGSAKIILEPWHGVFRPGHMSAFLVKNILPKLELEIQNLTINPHQQFLDPWRWVMSWKDMMPIQPMVVMLDKTFFPKWHQVLAAWLTNMPNYQDITKWYLGWKAQFPENLLGHPLIKDQFNKALETMNRAVSGNFVPGIKENIAYFTHAERRIMDSKTTPTVAPPEASQRSAGSVSVPTTFKELVERRAEEEDLLYILLAGKSQEGKQVYRFGKALIYYDHNVVFMQDPSGRWLPTSLNTLAEAAKK
ncbi:tuftelin-interacting protein 11 [Aplysia californica]|uniref:Tuftelin-interacting protein 11 n=1 Tax=Aplysia californica TaxID=6500 RepID=A0ABM1VXM1_APLCA|nr:tuftelin-interacting protein 11 [Aplysia californica]XP_035827164.1 tuftelin-interacting protein 11 [Aplysia californica]